MSARWYPLQVSDVIPLTKYSVEVRFHISEEQQSLFTFKAGQYLTLEAVIDGNPVRRSYSLCRAPEDEIWAVGIKKISGGSFSTYANERLKPGDVIQVMTPQGNFTIKETDRPGPHFVFFAAGSGITPVLSMIRHLLITQPAAEVTLFYGNKNVASTMFRDELDDLKNKYLNRISLHYIFSREKVGIPILHGRIDEKRCHELISSFLQVQKIDGYYICGPESMIWGVKDALTGMGVSSEKIHFELFYAAESTRKARENTRLDTGEAAKKCAVQIQMDGDIIEFDLEYGGKNLLDAAIDCGADLPYSCKGGVCSTCKAKVTSGQVSMDLNYALEPEEVAAGYVLLCQAHPRSEMVSIDFDQK